MSFFTANIKPRNDPSVYEAILDAGGKGVTTTKYNEYSKERKSQQHFAIRNSLPSIRHKSSPREPRVRLGICLVRKLE